MNDWFDSIFNVIQECFEYLDEAVKKRVIRKGKLVRKTFCKKGTVAKIAFTSQKISSYFSLKDKKLKHLLSHVVYHFTCSVCNDTYIGCTRRHFKERIHEHLNTKKESHIYQKSAKGKHTLEDSFKILDRASTF